MIGPKTRRYLAAKKGPGFAVLEELSQYDKTAQGIVKRAVDAAVIEAQAELNMHLVEVRKQFADRAEEIIGNLPGLTAQMEAALKKELAARLEEFRGEPGGEGPAPSDEKLLSLIQPLITLPTEEEILALIEPLIPEDPEDGKTPTQSELLALIRPVSQSIAKSLARQYNPLKQVTAIVRAMEALPYEQRLDYERGLKNTPGTPVEGPQRHTLHRGGGGSQVYEYDLSDLCDGVTKAFTIPSNTRVVHVEDSDAPSGILRKTVDWTGSGTTTLTLTAQVAAPGSGATLSLLYVA